MTAGNHLNLQEEPGVVPMSVKVQPGGPQDLAHQQLSVKPSPVKVSCVFHNLLQVGQMPWMSERLVLMDEAQQPILDLMKDSRNG